MAIGHRGRKVKGKVTRPQEITPLFLLPHGLLCGSMYVLQDRGMLFDFFSKSNQKLPLKKDNLWSHGEIRYHFASVGLGVTLY